MFTPIKPLRTCDPKLIPMVSSGADPFTPRRAVDSSGLLGSLYDACCDQVLPDSNLEFRKQSTTSRHPPSCYVAPYDLEQSQNLLDWHNMHDELILSVTLQMVHEMGVGALINYSRPIDKYTRFICYTDYSRTDYLSDNDFQRLVQNKRPMIDTSATHVIVLVNWGIDTVAVLQLPPDDQRINAIDRVLEKLCISLSSNQTSTILSEYAKSVLEGIEDIDVFSNIPELCKVKSIIDFHRKILQVKGNVRFRRPYNYNLYPIQSFYVLNSGKQGIFNKLPPDYIEAIEVQLLQLARSIDRLRATKDRPYTNVQLYSKDRACKMGSKWSELDEMYMCEIQRIRNLVLGIRRGLIEPKRIDEALDHDKRSEMMQSIDNFEYELSVMQEKEDLIDFLLKNRFEFGTAEEYGVKNGDNEENIKHILLSDTNYDRFICFNDILRREKKSEWDNLVAQLIEEHTQTPQLRCIFIDVIYYSCELKNFIVLHKTEQKWDTPASNPVVTPSSERSRDDGTINILLLGESGVGKSTFINAFANYLTFDELERAQKKPIVLMPVSFLMTVGDDFQEKNVTFGEQDNSSNEDYTHLGQSVTQHCKSYVFTLKDGENKGRKLRIIDTPGIGDVRGVAQDDINMQHILLYMSNLSHLNGVCILMKPNNARLNIFFRSCFVQLFDLLGENARDRIIFCFTNARATFYTPGNTAPLLKHLLDSLPVKNIPFTKQNTFCFDSESFRYLVAKQNKIEIGECAEKDYKDSWERSSTESKRFLQYISTKTTFSLLLLLGVGTSVKGAQLKIRILVRPILEAMRNILRNIVLSNIGSQRKSIELCPRTIKNSTAMCLTCTRKFFQVCDFWLVDDALHYFPNKCPICEYSPGNYLSIDYELEYKPGSDPVDNADQKMTKTLNNLCQTSAELARFLDAVGDIPQSDLFLAGLERMIKEEGDICKIKTPCALNESVLYSLEQLTKKYEETKKKLLVEQGRIDLSKIYDKIDEVSRYPMIESQVVAAKEWHKLMIRQYECEVPS